MLFRIYTFILFSTRGSVYRTFVLCTVVCACDLNPSVCSKMLFENSKQNLNRQISKELLHCINTVYRKYTPKILIFSLLTHEKCFIFYYYVSRITGKSNELMKALYKSLSLKKYIIVKNDAVPLR